MNSKKCLKCGHIASFTAQPLACPQCGAVYAKVEQALQNPLQRPNPAPNRSATRHNPNDHDNSHQIYAEQMRAKSLYPTFRALTQFAYVFMLVIAALVLVGGIFAFFNLSFSYSIGSAVTAIFIYIVARVGRELSLMLADLSDATVRMAAKQSTQD